MFSGCHFEYPMHIEYWYRVTSDISRIKYALNLALNGDEKGFSY